MKILSVENLSRSFGGIKANDNISFEVEQGAVLGVIGPNGAGKSTLFDLITGYTKADSGKINIGETIIYGYFNQKGIVLKEDKRVIEVLKDIADVIVMANGSKISASQLLEHFMFDSQMQYTYVSKLSGGEKRRLYLLTVLMKNPNFLILDEPTNDLDLLTLNKLEEFLLEFKGCLILVSHDRYFMDKLTDHLFVFKGAGVVEDHYCSYSELRNKQIKELKTNKKEEKGNKLKTKDTITFTEKKEYKSLEKQISKLELEKSNLEASFKNTTMDYELMMKKSKKLEDLTSTIDNKMSRWMDLEEKMG